MDSIYELHREMYREIYRELHRTTDSTGNHRRLNQLMHST
jgi:hypothetical protein